MDLFPELFTGSTAGLSASQFVSANGDQSGGAATQTFELFNPALTGTAQNAVGGAPLITLVGIIASVATANADLKLFTTTTAAVVSTAASAGPTFMDSRRSDTPIGTFKIGQVANPGSGLITTIPLIFGTSALMLPFNWDLSPGTGLVFTISGANRGVLTAIWIERVLTN